jgi:PadR family transcriptional regulator
VEGPLSTKAALLQALARPGYGLQLVERVRRATGGLVRLRVGSLYPALAALERKGLVRTRPGAKPTAVGRPRRYYELTPRGVTAAMAQRGALRRFFGPAPAVGTPSPAELMRDRIQACGQLSAFVVDLRRRTRRAAEERSR